LDRKARRGAPAVPALLDAVRQVSTAAPGQITLAFELYGPENI
jgi:hypothetical protein